MRITAIRDRTVSLSDPMSNASISFGEMTASAVAVDIDSGYSGVVTGYGFSSIGRYAHGGLISERFAPRLEACPDLSGDDGTLDPTRGSAVMMRHEKPGGDGERSGAVGVLEMALWDAAAKIEDLPLWKVLARRQDCQPHQRIPVYATGGHYYEDGDLDALRNEIRSYLDLGYERVKIKCGRYGLDDDCRRIETVLDLLGGVGSRLAVDVNCACRSAEEADEIMQRLEPYRLAWLEEPFHPHDFQSLKSMSCRWKTPIATGENLFSHSEARNLLLYGGLRSDRDWIQIDPALAYGLTEYFRILELAEDQGWKRTRMLPHAGHLLAFHAVGGLGLAAHEVAPGTDLPLCGYLQVSRSKVALQHFQTGRVSVLRRMPACGQCSLRFPECFRIARAYLFLTESFGLQLVRECESNCPLFKEASQDDPTLFQ